MKCVTRVNSVYEMILPRQLTGKAMLSNVGKMHMNTIHKLERLPEVDDTIDRINKTPVKNITAEQRATVLSSLSDYQVDYELKNNWAFKSPWLTKPEKHKYIQKKKVF